MSRRKGVACVVLLAVALLFGAPAEAQTKQFVVIFGTDQSQLTGEARKVIDTIVTEARARHPAVIEVAGYGDGETVDGKLVGDPALGKRRADAVMQALEAAGIERATLKEQPPLPPNKAAGIPVHKVTVTFQR
jgi:outer membrane protein OmpA-like peptidoglycan-associated protein